MKNITMKNFKSYIAILLTILILDGIWLGVIMQDFYLNSLYPVARDGFIVWPLVLFYLFYGLSILILSVIGVRDSKQAIWRGSWLGFSAYMTFELVNYGIIENWPFVTVWPDIVWGTFLTAVASLVGFKIFNLKK
jgi:uncharacterized membrane protein